MFTFQEMILQLSRFWAQQGCAIHHGYDLEVGAGTFNPATFLRCLGPEPYKAAYVEPSRRPKDGRYGENPNRTQFYYQFQVILKPSPANILDLYLLSLEAIGFELKKHDVRFVHDDWENPTIGASGLGWEVWIDGMEISQFTYFQTVGGLSVKPVTGEITYGLERLAMYLQKVDTMFDLKWNDLLLYGDIYKRNEWEWSHYNFSEANEKMWLRHFEDYEGEAKRLTEKGFPIPAYDFVMKASHAFNLLDSRGVISVTERTGYIGRIRTLAKMVAEAYVKSREEQGFPLLQRFAIQESLEPPKELIAQKFDPSRTEDFLLEIGSEELPASFVHIGVANLEKGIRKLFEDLQLPFTSLQTFGTPRRLAVIVSGLHEGTASQTIEKRGPPVNTAYDPQGNPTPAGIGFFKSIQKNPVTLSDIRTGKAAGCEIRELKGVEYLFASLEIEGKSTIALCAEALPKLILGIDFPKKMHWGNYDVEYARPLRWIVALFGKTVIPFSIANVNSGKISFGHPLLCPGRFDIDHPSSYVGILKEHSVMADIQERKTSIEDQLALIEKAEQGTVVARERVTPQVLHLVEWPMLTVGTFSPDYLKAPKEVLISEMVEHQKYYPLANLDGSLKSKFVITANNTPSDQIREGNQKALSPRLADGVFLYEEDLKVPLDAFNEKLKNVTFQKEIGSVYQKVERIVAYTARIHKLMPIADLNSALRAAALCKADLASLIVGEFPELQGVAGKLYALAHGENEEVASAIDEHWMPRGEKAPLPHTKTGITVSFADKIDNLISCFALDLHPTSSSDPYALRRQALGIIKIIIDQKLHLPIHQLLSECFDIFISQSALRAELKSSIVAKKEATLASLKEFITTRLKTVLVDMGYHKDEIEAVLAYPAEDIFETLQQVLALNAFRKRKESIQSLLEVYTRSKKILFSQNPKLLAKRQLKGKADVSMRFAEVRQELLSDPSEKDLHTALNSLKRTVNADRKEGRYEQAYLALSQIKPLLDTFFEQVKVIDNDPAIKNNRLALLQDLWDLCEESGDLSKIQEPHP